MALHADGGRLLNRRDKHESLEKAIERRTHTDSLYVSHYHWTARRRGKSLQYDLELLQAIERVRDEFRDQTQFRIEEPGLQFYAEDEETLKKIAESLNRPECILNITGPYSDEDAAILRTGAILTHKSPDFSYKIILKDGQYSSAVKEQVLNYLDSLGDEIKLTRACREMLNKSYPSIWGVYFYANDPKLATFITLIEPRMVSNIHELVSVDYK